VGDRTREPAAAAGAAEHETGQCQAEGGAHALVMLSTPEASPEDSLGTPHDRGVVRGREQAEADPHHQELGDHRRPRAWAQAHGNQAGAHEHHAHNGQRARADAVGGPAGVRRHTPSAKGMAISSSPARPAPSPSERSK